MVENESAISFNRNFINPEEVIKQMNISPHDYIADFGCGTGYFSLPLAKIVREQGRVYAFDVLKEKLEALQSQAKLSGIANILTQRVNLEKDGGSKLETGSMDWVVAKDMMFQNQNKSIILKEIMRVLKAGGKALIIEWKPDSSSVGPDASLRISKENLMDLIHREGFAIVKEIQVGDYHYGFIIAK